VPTEAVRALVPEHRIVTQVMFVEHVVVGDVDHAALIAPAIGASGEANAEACIAHAGGVRAPDRHLAGIFVVEVVRRQDGRPRIDGSRAPRLPRRSAA